MDPSNPAERRSTLDDPHDLNRFLEAQAAVYDRALSELRDGRKRSHWMWFIFPQLAGLGSSPMSHRYSIRSIEEAREYLAHPVLGRRLLECTQAVLSVDDLSATEILGSPDDMKLRSSATLFANVAGRGSVFERILEKYYDGRRDSRTEELLGGMSQGDGPSKLPT
jgi:uncharacterized protein (DUF1810 family)